MRNSKPRTFDPFTRDPKRNGEGEFSHGPPLGGCSHPVLFSSSKAINTLPGVSDTDKPINRKLRQHLMLQLIQILELVDEDQREPRPGTAKAHRHVDLVIEV